MRFIKDFIKRELIRTNRLQGTLEKLDIVTYQDKIRLRASEYSRRILFEQEGQNLVGELISRNEPLMISRIGSVELSCIRFYLEKRCRKNVPYSKKIKSHMLNNAGFFPSDEDSLDTFSKLYLENLKHVDALGIWFNPYEDIICNSWCKDAELVEIGCLEPYLFTNPWSAKLSGLKVLVVHPFDESIRKQYNGKRQLLFADPGVLPAFELKTIKAVQSIAGAVVPFCTWFDAYQQMCEEMAKVDFDICLIGAGAYGLPLAAFAIVAGFLYIAPPGILSKADAIGYAVCHRLDVRSFHVDSRQLPLCARCSGMYLGAVLGLVFLSLRYRRSAGTPPRAAIAILVLFGLAFAVDGANSYLYLMKSVYAARLSFIPNLYVPNNTLRLFTGSGMGLGMAVAVFVSLNQTLW
ncbi:MAG: DUF2085 domain-containing protein, partial [Deltaproteobacteria bacterium]